MYDDMIDIEYPFDLGHKRMSNYDRAKQFMPFSALAGYKEAICESNRNTYDRVVLDEDSKQILDDKLNTIIERIHLKPNVSITYFVPDRVKSGGSYNSINGCVKKVDLYKGIVFIDNYKISISDIVDIFV